ncbi:hypothetical protein E5288_WYG011556 [Bos mutus]|uniref:Uncharacterized protein n=1 Tax=Bos mutus TaxID=72004 RepID=A0A6B0RNV9_9CETA|nr:hypothetical protein [Bos mutus]
MPPLVPPVQGAVPRGSRGPHLEGAGRGQDTPRAQDDRYTDTQLTIPQASSTTKTQQEDSQPDSLRLRSGTGSDPQLRALVPSGRTEARGPSCPRESALLLLADPSSARWPAHPAQLPPRRIQGRAAVALEPPRPSGGHCGSDDQTLCVQPQRSAEEARPAGPPPSQDTPSRGGTSAYLPRGRPAAVWSGPDPRGAARRLGAARASGAAGRVSRLPQPRWRWAQLEPSHEEPNAVRQQQANKPTEWRAVSGGFREPGTARCVSSSDGSRCSFCCFSCTIMHYVWLLPY